MLPDAVTPENIVATIVVGIGLGLAALKKYYSERKVTPTPPAQVNDVFLPGVGIADMRPQREAAISLEKITISMALIAASLDGVFQILKRKQEQDLAGETEELRGRIRDLERSLEDSHRPAARGKRL